MRATLVIHAASIGARQAPDPLARHWGGNRFSWQTDTYTAHLEADIPNPTGDVRDPVLLTFCCALAGAGLIGRCRHWPASHAEFTDPDKFRWSLEQQVFASPELAVRRGSAPAAAARRRATMIIEGHEGDIRITATAEPPPRLLFRKRRPRVGTEVLCVLPFLLADRLLADASLDRRTQVTKAARVIARNSVADEYPAPGDEATVALLGYRAALGDIEERDAVPADGPVRQWREFEWDDPHAAPAGNCTVRVSAEEMRALPWLSIHPWEPSSGNALDPSEAAGFPGAPTHTITMIDEQGRLWGAISARYPREPLTHEDLDERSVRACRAAYPEEAADLSWYHGHVINKTWQRRPLDPPPGVRILDI